MGNPGLVSVIVPVYEGAAIVEGAVRSALGQTYRNLEVIVVDDGSTDATLDVLAKIDDPRLVVLRQANQGTAAARNLAIASARGSYFAFLDSDDRWFPSKIAREVGVLRAAGSPIAIAYSGYYPVDDTGRLLSLAEIKQHAGDALDLLLDGENFLMPSVCLFDRRIFDTLGTFNVERYNEDYDYNLRAASRFPIYPTGERLVVYRQTQSGKCRSILTDFERARAAYEAVYLDPCATFTAEQIERLRDNVLRSLYCRFLMYGFNAHARRIESEIRLRQLRANKKGWLAWFFAKTGINVMSIARVAVQTYHLALRQGSWKKTLDDSRLDLRYD